MGVGAGLRGSPSGVGCGEGHRSLIPGLGLIPHPRSGSRNQLFYLKALEKLVTQGYTE